MLRLAFRFVFFISCLFLLLFQNCFSEDVIELPPLDVVPLPQAVKQEAKPNDDKSAVDNIGTELNNNTENKNAKLEEENDKEYFGLRKQFENKKEYFGRILKDVKEKTANFFNEIVVEDVPVAIKVDPALKYPDPLFFDAIYSENETFDTYLYVYNDKTNPENNNIPEVYPKRFENQLFLLSKDSLKSSDLTRLLLALSDAKGFDIKRFVNSRNHAGDTPLLIAVRNNNTIAVNLLTQYGSDPSICNLKNICPFHMTVINDEPHLAKILLDYGADVMSEDIYGRNMIKFAIAKDMPEMFRVLIDAYTIGDARQNEKLDFMKFAMSFGRDKYVEYMYYKFGFEKEDKQKEEENIRIKEEADRIEKRKKEEEEKRTKTEEMKEVKKAKKNKRRKNKEKI